MTQITTYLCDSGISAVSASDGERARQANALSVTKNGSYALVSVKIGTPACLPGVSNKRVLSVKMLPISGLVDCGGFIDRIGAGDLSWKREIVSDNGGNFVSRKKYITIELNHPDDICHWNSTSLRGVRKTGEVRTYWNARPAIVSNGLLPDNKGAFVSFDTDVMIENGQTLFIPGELLQLFWALKYRGEFAARAVAGVYFATPAFTGGTVTGILNEDSEEKVVQVDVQNVARACMPTDWAAYQAGTWAFVLKQGDSDATEINRKKDFGGSSASNNVSESADGLPGQILQLMNDARASVGLQPLTISPTLSRASDQHSKDMAKNQFTGHVGSDGTTTEARVRATGYFELGEGLCAGENVASGYQTAEAVFNAWMSSPGHRANILNPDFMVVGISVEYSNSVIIGYNGDGTAITRPLEEGEKGSPYYTEVFGTFDDGNIVKSIADYRVVPITVNGYGNGGDFETKAYDMLSAASFERFFEVSQHIGVVTAVDTDNDTADIDIENMGSFEGVPIFYHCENTDSVAGGSAAFAVGDEVLVLNEGGKTYPAEDDLVIVGFKDSLKKCVSTYLLIGLGSEYILWDLKKKAIRPMLDGDGNERQPLSLIEMQIEIDKLGLVAQGGLSEMFISSGSTAPVYGVWWDSIPIVQDSYVSYVFGDENQCIYSHNVWHRDNPNSALNDYELLDTGLVFESFFNFGATQHSDIESVQSASYKVCDSEYSFGHQTESRNITRKKALNIYAAALGAGEKRRPCFFYYNGAYDALAWNDFPIENYTTTQSYSKSYSYFSFLSGSQVVSENILIVSENSELPTYSAFSLLDDFCESEVQVAVSIPCKSRLYNQFAIILEQPIIVDQRDSSKKWGMSQLYIGTGTPDDPLNPETTYTFEWPNVETIDMGAIFSFFSKTLDQDIASRGVSAGLAITIYDKV